MRRYHLFEWEDQPWLPVVFRDYLTDHLQLALGSGYVRPLHQAIADILYRSMQKLGTNEIVDLCSGGGGPLLAVQRYMRTEMNFETIVTLTDLYPNLKAFERAELSANGNVKTFRKPLSAFDVPSSLTGIRTLFTAFHHFKPSEAKRILLDACAKRCGIAIFEPFERSFKMAYLMGYSSIVRSLLLTPKIGRMSFERFLITYVLPAAPLIFAWDGIVSSLRSYTVPELLELATTPESDDYTWEAGQVPTAPGDSMPLTYLIGLPK
ncbi:MAG: hypothetical protein NTX44_04710 [Ignavibacteriales bacterium]|nr:hypothetical protein [Ignavibacteriales bacterium]